MEIYNFSISGEPYEVKITAIKKRRAEVEVNGRKYVLDIDEMGYHPPVIPPVSIHPSPQPSGTQIATPQHDPVMPSGSGKIKAPMPGQIIKTLVNEGDPVSNGDTIFIMESMNMENSIKTTIDGKIKKILVKPGDQVTEEQDLAEISSQE